VTEPGPDFVDGLRLDPDELLVLTVMQQLMLGRDLIAEKDPQNRSAKARLRDAFAQAAMAAHWSRLEDLPEWARESAAAIAARVPAQQRPAIETASIEFGARPQGRSRALLLLIELFAFQPWAASKWVPGARRNALAAVADRLSALQPGDLAAVTREYAAVSRALARRDVRWGRVAAVSVAGLALGVVTMGAAAPLIGAAVGGSFGLSGAAATSAGLAALGGGSVAAGGFGMAGGTALLAGIGGLGAAGAAAAGSRFSGWSAAQVVAEAVKLDVVTRLVILGAENDDAKARLVVEGLQARLDEVTAVLGRLAERQRTLSADNSRLSAENEQLRAELAVEREGAEAAEAALRVVIERIPVGA
jgi:hypothetical protein